jgi:23S rRNA (adenine2030-N6)-methyltransferase
MNYRHVFHAGNHADVFKHAALTLILQHLAAKPQSFAVLDTHAGVGAYDLTSDGAQRTKEYEAGVGLVFGRPLSAAPAYAALLAAMNPDGLAVYPGSPEISARLLRENDRLILCELHPDDAAALKARYRGDLRIQVHRRDSYEAAVALVPFPERRGLALIDPPYETPDEAVRVAATLTTALRKWPTGIFCAWYPIKDHAIGDALAVAARAGGFPKALRAEFLAYPMNGVDMAGGGLLTVGAPWKLDEKLAALCEELHPVLGEGHGSWRVQWVNNPPP